MSSDVSTSSKEVPNVPAFLTKLWLLVEDKETDKLIKWSQAGNSFIVYDPTQFAKEVLPKYFKHNNMPSFVRQLNMYGFRKKPHPELGGIIYTPEKNQIEFQHQHFIKGKQQGLGLIKRKISNKDELRLHPEGVDQILTDVKQMKSKQEGITGRLETMQRENDALWREVVFLRKRHEQQQKIVTRLIQFLMTLAQQNQPLKRPQLPMISGGAPRNAKYAKQDFMENVPMHDDELFCSEGATLSEVEDVPIDVAAMAALSAGTSQSQILLPGFTEENNEGVLLLGGVPIVTSPLGTDLSNVDTAGGNIGLDINPPLDSGMNVTGINTPVISGMGLDIHAPVTSDTDTTPLSAMPSSSTSLELMPHLQSEQSSMSSRPVLQRPLSVEEQRHEIGEQMSDIQNNLEVIQNLLANSARLQPENIWEIFRPEDSLNSPDFLDNLIESNGLNTLNPSTVKGTELVQYQPPPSLDNTFPSNIFSEEDEDLLLTSLDEDARNLVTQTKDDDGTTHT